MNTLKLMPIYIMLAAMLYIQIKAMPPMPEKPALQSAVVTAEQPAPLPDTMDKWTEDQLDDEMSTYFESIEIIKDEIRRRQRVEQRNEEKAKKQNNQQPAAATEVQ